MKHKIDTSIVRRHQDSPHIASWCHTSVVDDVQADKRDTSAAHNQRTEMKPAMSSRSKTATMAVQKDGPRGSSECPRRGLTTSANSKNRKPSSNKVYDPLLGRHPIPVVDVPDLMEQIVADDNIISAVKAVNSEPHKATGVDRKKVREVCTPLRQSKAVRDRLRWQLMAGEYRPYPVRTVLITKANGKMRTLGIAIVRDRIVQRMILQAVEANYPADCWSPFSYAYTAHRGVSDAIAEVDRIMADGYSYAVQLDLKAFFDNVPHDRLKARLLKHVTDKRVTALVVRFLTPTVICKGKAVINRRGTPQGSVISPWLASKLFLDELDKELAARKLRFVRYADDCTIFARSHAAAKRIKSRIMEYIEGTMQCPVNRDKTKVVPVDRMALLGVYKNGCHWSIQRQKVRTACGSFLSMLRKYKTTADEVFRGSAIQAFRGFLNHYRRIPDIAYREVPSLARWCQRRLREADASVHQKLFDQTPF